MTAPSPRLTSFSSANTSAAGEGIFLSSAGTLNISGNSQAGTAASGGAFDVTAGTNVTNTGGTINGDTVRLSADYLGSRTPVTVRVVARSSTLDLALLHAGSDLKRKSLPLATGELGAAGELTGQHGAPAVRQQTVSGDKAREGRRRRLPRNPYTFRTSVGVFSAIR